MTHQTQNPEMQRCIEACKECHDICLQMALTHCLQAGDKHGATCAACAESCEDMAKTYQPRMGGTRSSGVSPMHA